ncbi:MAG: PHB depolymerase family esterase [Dehalococcoidia bacterium]|jgi:polyhydroxybutyrate depolymerase
MRQYHFSRVIFSLLFIFLFLFQLACSSTGSSYSASPSQSQIANSKFTDNISEPPSSPLAPSKNGTIAGEKASDNQSNTAIIIYPKPARYDYQDSIYISGENRVYLVHIPNSYDGTKAVPLILVFHYYTGSPQTMADLSGFNAISDSNGFIVVYPAGIDTAWHFNLSQYDRHIDDLGFVSSLIDKLVKELNISKKMIYAAGFSDGAGMTHSLACRLSDRIAAAAMVATPFSQLMEDSYKPLQPVPVLIIQGTVDPICKFGGGAVGIQGVNITTLSIRTLVNYWIGYDGCSTTPKTNELPRINDGTKVDIEKYTSNSDTGEVIFYVIDGGGHTWPGGNPRLIGVGITSKTFSASQVIWQFFYKHPMK